MNATIKLSSDQAKLEPIALMGEETGIYFTFMSDINTIANIIPEPLEIAFPLVSGYIVEINKPSFAPPYKEAMLGVYVNYNGTVGMYPVSFLLSGPGAEMATYLGREKTGLPKKMCEREDCIQLIREGDVVRGIVERKGVTLMDVSLKIGEYNNPGCGPIYFDPEPGKVTGGTSFYFQTLLEPDAEGRSFFKKVNLLSNIAEYTYKTWQPGHASIRLQSSFDDPWGQFPVFEIMGGAYSTNDLEMKELFIVANPDPAKTMDKLLSVRFDKSALIKEGK